MAVFRVNKNDNYSVISNNHLREKRMSLKAKGLLTIMLSLREDWEYSIAGLVAICKENETAIKSTLKELQKFGYLRITKLMPNETESGRIEYVYDVFEFPVEVKQEGKKQGVENLPVENPGQLNTDGLSTDGLKKERDKAQPKRFQKPTVEQVRAYCQERRNSIDAEEFVDFYESKGWLVGKTPMKDWKASVRTWERSRSGNRYQKPKTAYVNPDDTTEWPSDYF